MASRVGESTSTQQPWDLVSLALGGNWHILGKIGRELENATSSPVFEMLPKECHRGAKVLAS